MQLEPKHYAVLAAMITGIATQLLTAQHGWADLATPGFVAGLLIQVATAISAIFVGAPGATAALAQANRNTDMANDSVRAALDPPPDPAKLDPKRFLGIGAIVLTCGLVGAAAVTMPGCASAPPAGTYSTAGLKAFNADQLLKDVTALSETAVNLNATAGPLHLQDRDTALVRDFALSAGAGLVAYGNGSGSLAIVVSAFDDLSRSLSTEATLNDKLRFVLALVADNIHRIPGQ